MEIHLNSSVLTVRATCLCHFPTVKIMNSAVWTYSKTSCQSFKRSMKKNALNWSYDFVVMTCERVVIFNAHM